MKVPVLLQMGETEIYVQTDANKYDVKTRCVFNGGFPLGWRQAEGHLLQPAWFGRFVNNQLL